MSQQIMISASKLNELAELLEQVSRAMRALTPSVKNAEAEATVPELVRPKRIPEGDEWFWSEEWQKGEREVNEQLKKGEYRTFDNVEELLADLHRGV